jgi:hypothetical protein
MPPTLLVIHSYLRWLILAAGLVTLGELVIGQARGSAFTSADKRSMRIYVGTLDLQFLLGLVLYGVSPLTRGAMNDMAAAMRDAHTRFFVAEHPVMMLLALVVAHAGSVWSRKAPTDRIKLQRAALGVAFSLGLILAGIPWFRMGA